MHQSPHHASATSVLPGMDNLPYDFDHNLESEAHRSNAELLTAALQLHFVDQPDIYVGANMAIYCTTTPSPGPDLRGPDVFVVKGAAIKLRTSWVVWEEDAGPDVIIELLSDSTRRVDLGEKMRVYARQLKVAWYFLFDPATFEFYAFHLDLASGFYVACPLDAEDRVDCPLLGLQLGRWTGTYHRVTSTFLRWYLPDGTPVPIGIERAQAAEARADQERARAEALRARLRALGIDPDAPV